MKKILQIGWKDLRVIFRDRAALILMLVAPLAMTIGMGAVTGTLGGSGSIGLQQVPVIVVNLDQETLGDALVEVFKSPELGELLAVTESSDEAEARTLVAPLPFALFPTETQVVFGQVPVCCAG